jgi:hypothetical protein
MELAYHVSFGVRPEKPANAETIGISDSLWGLMQKCWEGDRTRRPRIQEAVTGVGDAAASWHTDMPPSGTEHQEDSNAEEDSDELKHSEFLLVPIAPFSQTFCVVRTFEPYLSSSTGASQLSDARTVSTQPAEVETYEQHSEHESGHLSPNSPPHSAGLLPQKHKGFRRFLNRFPVILGHKPRR